GNPTGKRRARADAEGVARLLEVLPNAEIVSVHLAPPELDYHCGSAESLCPEFGEMVSGLKAIYHEEKADAIVTISHACQRSLSPFANDGLHVMSYISVVAESMGLPLAHD